MSITTKWEQKELAIRVLEGFTAMGIECCLAGGALRNWHQGGLANDLDIYVMDCRALKDLDEALMANILDVAPKHIELDSENKFGEEYQGSAELLIGSIRNFIFKGQVIQIMCVKENLQERVDKILDMDFRSIETIEPSGKTLIELVRDHISIGFNKGVMDSGGGVEWCPEAQNDLTNKTITVYTESMSDMQYRLMLTSHLPKMIKYYPDYRVRIVTEEE